MRKAAHPSGGMDSSNPCHWRDGRLHHHGRGVYWIGCVLWMVSWRHKLIVCKKWYKNNPKMRLTALLSDPPMRAPYLKRIGFLQNESLNPRIIATQKTLDPQQLYLDSTLSFHQVFMEKHLDDLRLAGATLWANFNSGTNFATRKG